MFYLFEKECYNLIRNIIIFKLTSLYILCILKSAPRKIIDPTFTLIKDGRHFRFERQTRSNHELNFGDVNLCRKKSTGACKNNFHFKKSVLWEYLAFFIASLTLTQWLPTLNCVDILKGKDALLL